jgi:Zn-finger nucleic acid-binding protein
VLQQPDPSVFPPGPCPARPVSYHVGLDTMMGRRCRHRPDEVTINGFLLLDTGEYELVIAHIPLDVFWKMKALDVVGHVRTANRARAAVPRACPQVGSVWLVDGELEEPATEEDNEAPTASAVAARAPDRSGSSAHDSAEKIFRLRVHAVYALDRVALEPKGPRFIETLHVRDMLPEFQAD